MHFTDILEMDALRLLDQTIPEYLTFDTKKFPKCNCYENFCLIPISEFDTLKRRHTGNDIPCNSTNCRLTCEN